MSAKKTGPVMSARMRDLLVSTGSGRGMTWGSVGRRTLSAAEKRGYVKILKDEDSHVVFQLTAAGKAAIR